MGRTRTRVSQAPRCPDCEAELEPIGPGPARFACPVCRGVFRVERVPSPAPPTNPAGEPPSTNGNGAPVGSLSLRWRGLALWTLARLYWSVTAILTAAMLALGGFVTVLGGWLRDEIAGWADVVEALGGAWFRIETSNPDADLGPIVARLDAPLLFDAIDLVSRRLGIKRPGQIRLAHLPCCGVVAWGRSRALLIGLPLLRVLTRAELRAIVAHELAHLARGDATRAARLARFVEGLERAVERRDGRLFGPLGSWARFCLRAASRLIEPVAWGQETRADRLSALIAGGGAAASALVKTAMVQPLFREALDYYDPETAETNLYAFFRSFWSRLPVELRSDLRLRLLADGDAARDPAHPPLRDRLTLLQSYPDHVPRDGDSQPAATLLGDLEIFEQMLHNRLFGATGSTEPSVFHRARA